jgi:hypothetical protein
MTKQTAEQYLKENSDWFDKSPAGEKLYFESEVIKMMKEYSLQIEISDKVLFEQATVAMEEHYGYGCETEIDAYFRGAKWMQKQGVNK